MGLISSRCCSSCEFDNEDNTPKESKNKKIKFKEKEKEKEKEKLNGNGSLNLYQLSTIPSGYSTLNFETSDNNNDFYESHYETFNILNDEKLSEDTSETFEKMMSLSTINMKKRKKKVSFYDTVEIRSFISHDNLKESEEEYKQFKEYVDSEFYGNSNINKSADPSSLASSKLYYLDSQSSLQEEKEKLERNISFEDLKCNFIIEENMHRLQSNYPKSFEDLKQSLQINEIQTYFPLVRDAINTCKFSNKSFFRIDGIILTNSFQELIIISESYIFDFFYNKAKRRFLLNNEIKISNIDYLSLSHDNTILIIHLNPTISKNFIIIDERLNEVASILSGNCLCDKLDQLTECRKIPVVIFNKNFEIVKDIAKSTEFIKYADIINSFLDEKVNQLKNNGTSSQNQENLQKATEDGNLNDLVDYKYTNIKYTIKYRTKSSNKNSSNYFLSDAYILNGDLIITSKNLYILQYSNSKFKIKFKISIESIEALKKDGGKIELKFKEQSEFCFFYLISDANNTIYNLINKMKC